MVCSDCGKENLDDATYCVFCGRRLVASPSQPTAPASEPVPFQQPTHPQPSTSALAVASLVLGCLGLLTLGTAAFIGLILGVVSIIQICRSRGQLRGWKIALSGIIISALMMVLVPMATLTILARAPEAARKASCQTNMHEIAMAFEMYVGDYDGRLPTWATYRGKPGATPDNFRKLQGQMPPPPPGKPYTTWPMRLSLHLRNKDVIWCPSDNFSEKPEAEVSYFLKKVVDPNYAGGSVRKSWKEGDFNFPAEQVLFYENCSFHWGGQPLSDGALINVAFFDSHVKTVRLRDFGPQDEPDFFNWDPLANNEAGGPAPKRADDPRKYCDRLD
jgi:prepilin-type processing-associated H-X9-DG protein